MLCVIINTTDGEVVDLQAPASAEVCDAVWAALVRTLGLGITEWRTHISEARTPPADDAFDD